MNPSFMLLFSMNCAAACENKIVNSFDDIKTLQRYTLKPIDERWNSLLKYIQKNPLVYPSSWSSYADNEMNREVLCILNPLHNYILCLDWRMYLRKIMTSFSVSLMVQCAVFSQWMRTKTQKLICSFVLIITSCCCQPPGRKSRSGLTAVSFSAVCSD